MGYSGPYSLRARCASEVIATLIGVFLGNGCIANTQLSRTKVPFPKAPPLPPGVRAPAGTPLQLRFVKVGTRTGAVYRATVSRSDGLRWDMACPSGSASKSLARSARTSTRHHVWRLGS